MIFVEGPDKVGKTTFCEAVAAKFKGEYFHFENPPPGVIHINEATEFCQSLPYNTVFDRFALSGLAYDFKAPVDPTRMLTTWEDIEHTLEIASIHQKKGKRNLLIQVRATDEVLAQRLADEGDANDYVVERELLFVGHIYDLMFHSLRLSARRKPDLMTYDTSATPLAQILSMMGDRLGYYLQ